MAPATVAEDEAGPQRAEVAEKPQPPAGGIAAEPEFVSVYRHQRAIPQYLVGHAERLRIIDEELSRFPGLVLTGNAFRGVSLNDCVLNAMRTAESLLPQATDPKATPTAG